MLGFVPLRSINKVYKETVVFSEKDGKISGHLAFDNPRGILLRTRDGFVLEEGADYRVEKNEVILLNKSIPYFKKEWLKNENVPSSIPSENGEYDVGKCLIISPAYLRSVQILADYDCDKTPFPSALPYKINLEKSYKKLTEDKKLRIALYGDSVCNAANSSWEIGFEGYKRWMNAAAERSEKFYGAKIEVVNFSRSGYGIGWGLEAAEEKFGGQNFDMVVIGLGGNDAAGGMSVADYADSLKKTIDIIRLYNPEADIVLLSPTPQNPDCEKIYNKELLLEYAKVQENMQTDGIIAVNLERLFYFLAERKDYCEISGNNLNHPNDFWYEFYTDAFVELFYRMQVYREVGEKLEWGTYFSDNGFDAVRFSALPKNIWGGYLNTVINGKEMKSFAFMGKPAVEENKKYPAVVLVHGGGGNAYYKWVEQWTARGYVAMSLDINFCHFTDDDIVNAKRNPWVKGYGIGSFPDIMNDPRESYTYYSVAQIAAAHSYLLSQNYVDRNKTGVVGISWGGVMALIALGIDPRFCAGAIIYSAGFITEDLLGEETGLFKYLENKKFYDTYYDPRTYVNGINVPVIMQAGLNDAAFSPLNRKRTYSLFAHTAEKAIIPDLYHDNESNFGNKTVFSFMNDRLRGTDERVRLESAVKDGYMYLTVDKKIDRAEMLYTDGVGDPHKFVWQSENIHPEKNMVISLPKSYKYVMATVYYGDGLYTSSDIYEN